MQTLRLVALISLAALNTLAFGQAILYVDESASAGGDGSSWPMAFTELQPALALAASNGIAQEIRVAQGTYLPDTTGLGDPREAAFQLVNGVTLYGGFPTGGGDLSSRDPGDNPTILSGDIGASGVDADNCYHVFYHPDGLGLDTTATIDGFIITKGQSDSSSPHRYGGGMYNYSCHPTISNCTFIDNYAVWSGGGMYNRECASRIVRCRFLGNSAGFQGGAMYIGNSETIEIWGCVFSGNSATTYAGSIYNGASSANIVNCTFSLNSAGSRGGGLYNYSGIPTLSNCVFSGNSADVGPQIHVRDDSVIVTYTYAEDSGSETWFGAGCMAAGNVNFQDADGTDDTAGTLDDDLHLNIGSVCINGGSNDLVPAELLTDLDGENRMQECLVDMGADETGGTAVDCNTNGLDDGCEPLSGGDFDASGEVDLSDYIHLFDCFAGAGSPPSPEITACVSTCLQAFDANHDGDIDLQDFAEFQIAFTGS